MMNIVNRVTLNNLKKNRFRTIVTIIGVILSAAMISAVTTFAQSIQTYLYREEAYYSGDWYGNINAVPVSLLQNIRNSKSFNAVYAVQNLGYADIGSYNDFKPYLYVGGVNADFFEPMSVHLTQGRLPENSSEILLPDHLLKNGGVSRALGDVLNLSLGQRLSDGYILNQNDSFDAETLDDKSFVIHEKLTDPESYTFTVVGFYERPGFEPYEAAGYTALTLTSPKQDASYNIFLRTSSASDIYQVLGDIKAKNPELSAPRYNRQLLHYTGTFTSDNVNQTLYRIAAIVILLILTGAISLIYNAFAISVSERTRQFGLLSSVGATRRQLKRSVLFESLFISLIGIPLGILSGIGGIAVTLKLLAGPMQDSILNHSHIELSASVSLFSILSAAVISLVTILISAWIPSRKAARITAMEAIRQNQEYKNKRKSYRISPLHYKLFGMEGVLSKKYYLRSRSKYRTTVFSLAISIILFVSVSGFTGYLVYSSEKAISHQNYQVGAKFIPYCETEEPITMDDLNKIKEEFAASPYAKEVKALCLSNFSCLVRPDDLTENYRDIYEDISDGSGDVCAPLTFVFVDEETYQKQLESSGFKAQQLQKDGQYLPLIYKGDLRYNSESDRYETDPPLVNTVSSVKLYMPKFLPGYCYKGSDDNTLYYYSTGDDSSQELSVPRQDGMFIQELPLDSRFTADQLVFDMNSGYALIYPFQAFSAVTGIKIDYPIRNWYSYQLSSDDADQLESWLNNWGSEQDYGSFSITNLNSEMRSNQGLITIIKVFSWGFIILISLIAAANAFNSISTNIMLRRRDFAMLESIGMTQTGLNRMMDYECILYGIRALMYGLPVSALIIFLIYLSLQESIELTLFIPWSSVIIAVCSVFIIVFAAMLYSRHKLRKESLTEVLKNENI